MNGNPSPARRSRIGLAIAVGLLLGGAASTLLLDYRVSTRIDDGLPVPARVVGIAYFLPGRGDPGFQRVTIRYHVEGEEVTATLMAAFDFEQRYAIGDDVTVYVSRSNHHEVATRAGYASENWLMLLPSALISIGGILTINFLVELIRTHRRRVLGRPRRP